MTLSEWLDAEKAEWFRRRAHGRSMTHKEAREPPRGTQAWLAEKLGVDPGLVSKWVRRVSEPVTHGPRIVRLSGGKVTPEELRRVKERG